MSGIIRFLIGMALAALVVFGLFMLMIYLISGDFQPGEKSENASFEINPVIEDVETIERETKIDRVEQVQTPPPPPMIERAQADKPSERIASLEGAVPEFEAPKIDKTSFKIAVSDRDAQPLVRIPPVPPPDAQESGHCDMTFDVSPDGQPFNINANCTDRVFRRSSVRAVEKWKYQPKIQDGAAVGRTGVQTRLTYRIEG